jgi:hypothetical protein
MQTAPPVGAETEEDCLNGTARRLALDALPTRRARWSLIEMPTISIPNPLLPGQLPPIMVNTDRWLTWRFQTKKSGVKPTKVPLTPGGVPGNATDPATWLSFTAANTVNGYAFNGRGFAFTTDDDIGGVDIDNCLDDNGNIKAWAEPVLQLFLDAAGNAITYADISPSKRGIKFFGRFFVPRGRKFEFWINGEKCGVEAYSQGRYFRVTADHWNNPPLVLRPIQAAVEKALEIAVDLNQRYPPPTANSNSSAGSATGTGSTNSGSSGAGSTNSSSSSGAILPGQRHDAIEKFAVKLRLAGLADRDLRTATHGFNRDRCQPPKDAKEADDIVDWVLQNVSPRGSGAAAKETDPNRTTNVVPWPDDIDEAGMYGLAGDFVRLVRDYTEADPNALLFAFLTCAGNVIGRNFYVAAGAERHCGNLYTVLVGNTSFGRKGTALSTAEMLFLEGPKASGFGNVLPGISTGEGLIWEIRDAISTPKRDNKTGKVELVETDPGVKDKRLLFILGEFYQALCCMRRKDSTLSSVLRNAWDKDKLATPAKNNPARVRKGALVSLLAGSAPHELLNAVESLDSDNGTLNRFLWICTTGSKRLPEGEDLLDLIQSPEWDDLQARFRENIAHIGDPLRISRDADAQDDWGRNDKPGRGLYYQLTQPRTGLWGDVTARAAQQVIRISLIHAVINGRREIRREHQDAALSAWRYADQSAQRLFGALDDPDRQKILDALRQAGTKGLTRTEIRALWSGNKLAEEIASALTALARAGLAKFAIEKSGGHPTERWWAM